MKDYALKKVTKLKQRGFTMLETVIALSIITMISLVVVGSLSPWMSFKQKLDTDRKIQDIRQGFSAIYNANAFAIEMQASGLFKDFVESGQEANGGGCVEQDAAFLPVSDYFSETPQQIARDGYGNPWCIRISPSFKVLKDGVDLWYRNIAVISTGPDGKLAAETVMNPDGTLTMGGDDRGAIVSGREIQSDKLKETLRRMNRVAQMYETYFTTRYLANSARDISIYYFSNQYDTSGLVAPTNGVWTKVSDGLKDAGVGATDGATTWELENFIEFGNSSEAQSGVQVRSPATAGVGGLPYTAMLRARVPGPDGQEVYATQIVVGNY